jgi:hypothetical protein
MLQRFAILTFLSVGLTVPAIGCGDAGRAKDARSASAAKDSDKSEANEVAANLKQLDEADRKLAEKQKYCPIGGGLLGSMGKPHKMTVKGRTIFLCCPHCAEEVNTDPDGALKKVDALLAKK